MEDDHEDEHKPINHNHVSPPTELDPAAGGEEEPSPDPGSEGRLMKIKIKMPPSAPPHPPPPLPRPLPEPNNLQERSFGRVCCGKFFSSGKAWGGHKRHHGLKEFEPKLQPPKNTLNVANKLEEDGTCNGNQVEKKKKKNEKVGVIKAGDVKVSKGGTPECCLCGKNFPSMNSLFGHMRFHRDRGWKGIKPPPTKQASGPKPSCPLDVRIKNPSGSSACLPSTSPSDSENDSTGIARADLMGSLPVGWTTKGRRGRVGSCPFDYSPPPVLVSPSFTEMFRYPVRFSGNGKGEEEDDDDAVVVVHNNRKRKDVDNNGGEEEEEEDRLSKDSDPVS